MNFNFNQKPANKLTKMTRNFAKYTNKYTSRYIILKTLALILINRRAAWPRKIIYQITKKAKKFWKFWGKSVAMINNQATREPPDDEADE